MRNHCLDVLRSRKTRREGRMEESSEAMAPVSDEPQSRYEASEYTTLVRSLLKILSPKERQVLVLRAFEGREYDEIQTISGMSPLSLRVHLSNARRKIRNALKSMEV